MSWSPNEPSSFHIPRNSRHSLDSLKIPLAIRWHSTTGSSSEYTIRRAHVMFIALIRLAKPDSKIHLVRSFLFSQLFEGLSVSPSCCSNRMTKNCLLTEPQHNPGVNCSKTVLLAGSTICSHLFSLNQPSRMPHKPRPNRHAREEV